MLQHLGHGAAEDEVANLHVFLAMRPQEQCPVGTVSEGIAHVHGVPRKLRDGDRLARVGIPAKAFGIIRVVTSVALNGATVGAEPEATAAEGRREGVAVLKEGYWAPHGQIPNLVDRFEVAAIVESEESVVRTEI